MDARTLGAAAFKVWGLILLLTSVVTVPTTLLAMAATPYPAEQAELVRGTLMSGLLGVLASATLGLFLFLWGDWLARRALPESGPIQIALDAAQLLSVALAVVGAVFLVGGLADAASLGYVLHVKPEGGDFGSAEYLWEREGEAMVRAAVYIVAGLVLLLGRTGLGRAWAEVRSFVLTGGGLTRQ